MCGRTRIYLLPIRMVYPQRKTLRSFCPIHRNLASQTTGEGLPSVNMSFEFCPLAILTSHFLADQNHPKKVPSRYVIHGLDSMKPDLASVVSPQSSTLGGVLARKLTDNETNSSSSSRSQSAPLQSLLQGSQGSAVPSPTGPTPVDRNQPESTRSRMVPATNAPQETSSPVPPPQDQPVYAIPTSARPPDFTIQKRREERLAREAVMRSQNPPTPHQHPPRRAEMQGRQNTKLNSPEEQASERLRSRLASLARTNSSLDTGKTQTRTVRGGFSARRGRGFSRSRARGGRRGAPGGRRDRDIGGLGLVDDDEDWTPLETPSVTTADVPLLEGSGLFGHRKSSELLLISPSLREASLPSSLVQAREKFGGDYSRYGPVTRFDSSTSLSKLGPLRHARMVLSHQKDFNGGHRAQVEDIIESSISITGSKQITRT